FHQSGYAARVVDRVRLDPRHTEFRTDLSAVPAEVLAHLDRNPNSDTYQFIVRAVPRAWARPDDDQEAPRAGTAGPVAARLAGELAQLQDRLREQEAVATRYAERAVQAEADAARQRAKGTAASGDADARFGFDPDRRRVEDEVTNARELSEAKRLHRLGPL